ncbi:MAG: hypothetical protein ACLSG5_17215 [Oscillospiraceae bacterium]
MKLYAIGALLSTTRFRHQLRSHDDFPATSLGVQSSDEITVRELLEWAEKYVSLALSWL